MKGRCIGLLGAVCVLFSVGSAMSESPPASAVLVAVQLFSVREVQSIAMVPLGRGSWMRTCPQCPKQPIPAPVQLENGKGAVKFASGATSKRVELSGAFIVRADGYEREVNAAGTWSIRSTQSGLSVLLSLPSERYVVAALEGEASPDEPMESLKAMAVSMRTFALVNANRHISEGFGLCDSTHCQALRFGRPRPEVERAVKETAGETLWSGHVRAHIYFTQNCGGVTEAASNVWPHEQAAYLSSHLDPYCLRRSSSAWSAQVSLDQLSTIFQHEGWHTPALVRDVRIVDRTPSGRVRRLEVSGSGAHAPISASSFRFAVNRALGWNQLRSDWYSVKVLQGVLHVEGKSYGHGVGLCQAGAYEMAEEGHDYRQILNYYFPGTVARVEMTDSGWKSYQGSGLMLLSVTSATSLLAQADKAWTRANLAFPVSASLHPKVYALPTTELFRQTTGEPGWVLASTRESDVYLQPLTILEKSGGIDEVLEHEFLHVLIEHEATSLAPLWLREGLAEELAESSSHTETTPKVSLAELEAALTHPVDSAASQRAHLVAGQMAREMVKRYGLAIVRHWLRDGIPTSAMDGLAKAAS